MAHEELLAAKYDEQLQNEPNDAALLYLRGRVGPTRADQLQHFQLANDANPALGWPAMSLGYDAANRGKWHEAKQWSEKGINVLRQDPSFRAFTHIVRMANGESATLEKEYRQSIDGPSQDYLDRMASVFYLSDVLSAQEKCDETRQVLRQWLAQASGQNSATETLATSDVLADYLCGNVAGFQQYKSQTPPKNLLRYHFHFLLAIGEPDAAMKLDHLDELVDDWPEMLSVSLAYSLVNNAAEADAWRMKACDKLRGFTKTMQRCADLLQRDIPPTTDDLDELSLRLVDTPLVLAAIAQKFPARKLKLNQRTELLNVSRQPPYLLVKRAVEQR
jgi:hypothetical protein